jgi:uncharacterized protein
MTSKKDRLPSREECMQMFDEFDVPENVRLHSFMVNKVSVFLAQKLKEAGEDIDIDLVDRASLLHDLDKIPTLHNHDHGKMTLDILEKKGHKKVGEIIKKHIFSDILDGGLKTWEEKIVSYADKICQEDQIVLLDERFAYGRKRYAHHQSPRTKEAEDLFRALEKDIHTRIKMTPEQLKETLK